MNDFDEVADLQEEIKILKSQVHSWKKECEKRDEEISRLRSRLEKVNLQRLILKAALTFPKVETGSSTKRRRSDE